MLRRILVNSLALVTVVATNVDAQDLDCDAVLRFQAYDLENISISQDILITRRDDLCSRDYSSLQEAQTRARSQGFNLGYAGLSIGASGASQNANGRTEISETEFCRATIDDFQSAYSLNYNKQVASVAAQNWLECIRVAGEDRLYMSYTIRGNGSYFDGELHYRTSGAGAVTLNVTGINVIGPGSDGVTCQIQGSEITAESVLSSPLQIDASPTPVACERTNDEDVSIAVVTSSGSLGTVYLPSPESVEVAQWEDLRSYVTELESRLQQSDTELAGKVSDLEKELNSSGETLLQRVNEVSGSILGTISSLGTGGLTYTSDPNWGTNTTALCPAGQMMVGARVNVATGGNAGALYSGIQPICRRVLP